MARPVKERTTASYNRDVEAINRLRIAILQDMKIEPDLSKAAVQNIDKTVQSILAIIKSQEET